MENKARKQVKVNLVEIFSGLNQSIAELNKLMGEKFAYAEILTDFKVMRQSQFDNILAQKIK